MSGETGVAGSLGQTVPQEYWTTDIRVSFSLDGKGFLLRERGLLARFLDARC
jgi:hypothetical protein